MILSLIKYPGECGGGLNLAIQQFSVFFFFKEKIDGKFVSVPLSLFVQVFFFFKMKFAKDSLNFSLNHWTKDAKICAGNLWT